MDIQAFAAKVGASIVSWTIILVVLWLCGYRVEIVRRNRR